MIKIILVLNIALFARESHGQICGSRDVSLYFANGMFNSVEAAEMSRKQVSRIAKRPVKLSYNFSETAILQLIQVAEQKDFELKKVFWQWLADEMEVFEIIASNAPGGFLSATRAKMLELAVLYDQALYVMDADLRSHVKAYSEDLGKGRHVSVVAHSQGNFYANSAGELLNDSGGRYRVMGVAVPASRVYGDGPYMTLEEDKVMAAVRIAKGALPANVSTGSPTPSGHEFAHYAKGGDTFNLFEEELESILWDNLATGLSNNSGGPSIFEPALVDDSLRTFWRYTLNVLTDKKRPLKPHECLAMQSFSKIYPLLGETCKRTSLSSLLALMNQCLKWEWVKNPPRPPRDLNLNCALESLEETDPMMTGGGPLQWRIETTFEECQRLQRRGLVEANFNAAVELITKPPPRKIP